MSNAEKPGGFTMNRTATFLLVAAICLGASVSPLLDVRDSKAATATIHAIEWKDLVPAGYDPSELIKRYNNEVARLKDNDPRAERLAEQLRRAWEDAPVVGALNNKTVRLSGFLVTLEGDGKAVSE